jgi:hypothetical protein
VMPVLPIVVSTPVSRSIITRSPCANLMGIVLSVRKRRRKDAQQQGGSMGLDLALIIFSLWLVRSTTPLTWTVCK